MKTKLLKSMAACRVIATPSKIVKRNGKDVVLYDIFALR